MARNAAAEPETTEAADPPEPQTGADAPDLEALGRQMVALKDAYSRALTSAGYTPRTRRSHPVGGRTFQAGPRETVVETFVG